MSENFKRTVEASYERIAERHPATKILKTPYRWRCSAPGRAGERPCSGAITTGLGLLRGAGFAVERTEVRTTSGDESWL